MRRVTQREFRDHFEEIMHQVTLGEEVSIMRGGITVAVLSPIKENPVSDLMLRHGTGEMVFPRGVRRDTTTASILSEMRSVTS